MGDVQGPTMKLRFVAGLVFLTVFSGASMARDDIELSPRCSGIFNLCGYVDRTRGTQVIDNTFERAMAFGEGLAAVRIEGRYGYVNASGRLVIQPAFDHAGTFYHGLAEVIIDGKAGVIDRHGDILVEPQFARAIPITRKVVLAERGTWREGDIPGKTIPDARAGSGDFGYGPFGLYHVEDGWVQEPRYYFLKVFERDGRGLVWASEHNRGWGPFGLLRADGTWQVKPAFGYVKMLEDGIAIVGQVVESPYLPDGPRVNGPSGAVDKDGNLVIPMEFDWLSDFEQGFARTHHDGKPGLVDKQGGLVGGRYFEDVDRPDKGGLPKVKVDEEWFFVRPDDTLSEEPLDAEPDRSTENRSDIPSFEPAPTVNNTECSGGAVIYEDNGRWGIKGPSGSIIIEARYQAIDCFTNGVAWVPVEDQRRWCPVGPDGKLRDKPDCVEFYYPVFTFHYTPERFDDNPFKSNVLWMRAFLYHGLDPRKKPPTLVSISSQPTPPLPVRDRSVFPLQ